MPQAVALPRQIVVATDPLPRDEVIVRASGIHPLLDRAVAEVCARHEIALSMTDPLRDVRAQELSPEHPQTLSHTGGNADPGRPRMREFVRSDLPELIAVGDRIRSAVARSSTAFALLAGVGAALIFGDVLRTIASGVFDVVPVQNAPRPFDFQQILGPAAGLVVARRAGGIAGALAYLGYSGIVLALGWLGRALTCAGVFPSDPLRLGLVSFCTFGPLDLLAGATPVLIGLAIGAVVARTVGGAPRAGANPLLEAAGAHVIPSAVFAFGARAFAVQSDGVPSQLVAVVIAMTVISGVLAGVVAGLRSATPLRTAVVLVLLLIATWLYPLGASQLQTVAGADRPEVYLFALPLLDVVTIPLAAWYASRRWRTATRF